MKKLQKIVKICLDSIKEHSAGRVVEVLDLDNLGKYVEIPGYILKKYKESKISHQHFSDIVRSIYLMQSFLLLYVMILTQLVIRNFVVIQLLIITF